MGVEQLAVTAVVGVIIVGAVSAVAPRLKVAAPLILVAVGVLVGIVPGVPQFEITADLFLTLVLPPLLYSAALSIPFVDFRRSLRVITLLAFVLVVVSALGVGFVVNWMDPAVPLALAIALGAVVAPPDAVAATAIAKSLGLPKRDVTILEGEALCNDAAALVMLSLATSVAVSGRQMGPGAVAWEFVWAVLSAVVIGSVVGFLAVAVRRVVNDRVLEVGLSMIVPFVAYIVTEEVHGSGVVAVVTAGLWVGNRGEVRLSARNKMVERTNWGSISLILENLVFLYMGYRIPAVFADARGAGSLWGMLGMGLTLVAVLILLRLAMMPVLLLIIRSRSKWLERQQNRGDARFREAMEKYGNGDDAKLSNRLRMVSVKLRRHRNDLTAEQDQQLNWKDGLVIGWAGMRGVVTVIAVGTLPATGHEMSRLTAVAYVVAVVTLLLHGLTLTPLIKKLNLKDAPSKSLDLEIIELQRRLGKAGMRAVRRGVEQGEFPPDVAKRTEQINRERMQRTKDRAKLRARVRSGQDKDQEEKTDELIRAGSVYQNAQMKELRKQRSLGDFSSEAIGEMLQILDREELAQREREALFEDNA